MESQPLWVVGAPRSGTTFLCAVLNRHPMVTLTNESRIWVLLKRVIEVESKNAEFIDPPYQRHFVAFVRHHSGALVEDFYREELGILTPIWGDKHPPYADPTVLSGRVDGIPRHPLSGSCLRLIRESLPGSKFIHIHREPGQVAHSMALRGWVGSVAEGVAVWRQYVSEILHFFEELPADQRFTIAYCDLLREPEKAAAQLARFLGLADSTPFRDFLLAQRDRPTPFSEPMSDLGELYRSRGLLASTERTLGLAGNAAASLGYRAA